MITEIAHIVRGLVNSDYLYFQDPLVVKMSPHTYSVNLWAVCVTPAPYNKVYVMDAGENWAEVEENDTTVIQSLYQRVQFIQKLIA